MRKVLGVGAALVDLLALVEDSWITLTGVKKGDAKNVDFETFCKLKDSVGEISYAPGGSASNTIVGLSKLGANTAFLSKIKDDELGRLYREHLKNSGVESKLLDSSVPTGRVLSAITPDAERTMYSFLGASDTLLDSEITNNIFTDVDIVYLEGYVAFAESVFRKVVDVAKSMNIKVALDLGSIGVVTSCKALLSEMLLHKKIDILFANEEEAFAYTGHQPLEALKEFLKYVNTAVVKVGKLGALIESNGTFYKALAGSARALDTTGAGDLFASGFLYGYLNGFSVENCGKLASVIANEVVQVKGAQIQDAVYTRIKNDLRSEFS